MSLLLVCGAVFIGKEGRSSKIPPATKPRGHFTDYGQLIIFGVRHQAPRPAMVSGFCSTMVSDTLLHRDVGGTGPEAVDVAVGDGVESA